VNSTFSLSSIIFASYSRRALIIGVITHLIYPSEPRGKPIAFEASLAVPHFSHFAFSTNSSVNKIISNIPRAILQL